MLGDRARIQVRLFDDDEPDRPTMPDIRAPARSCRMGALDLTLAACFLGPFAVFGLAFAVLLAYRRRQHREGMERFRAACRLAGLRQTPEFWERDTHRAGARQARYQTRTGNRQYDRFSSYVAKIDPPLAIDLHVFRDTVPTLSGRTARIVHWRSPTLPSRVQLASDPEGRALEVHAANVAAAHALMARPEVVAALRDALAVCADLRIVDHEVELLTQPYEGSPEAIDATLQLAARIAHVLRA